MTAYNSHTLSLYCDNASAAVVSNNAQPGEHQWGDFPALYYHQNERICRQQAKRAGWRFLPDGRTLCPRCGKAGIRTVHGTMRV